MFQETPNYHPLFVKLTTPNSKGITSKVVDKANEMVDEALGMFQKWSTEYINRVSKMVEEAESKGFNSVGVGDTGIRNIFSPAVNPTVQKPVANEEKIEADIINNWYQCLVMHVSRNGNRKARRVMWKEMASGRLTSSKVAKTLQRAKDEITEAYK